MTDLRRIIGWGSTAVLMAGAGCPDMASAANAPDGAATRTGLDEIVVTATKTGDTNLQETALAISSLGGEDLADLGIRAARELEYLVPSMQNLKVSHMPGLFIRGVGSSSSFPAQSDAVGVYVDDVYTARYTGLQIGLLDIQRVEVLRGPQGTIYGRNATAGAVRYITAQPTDTLDGYLEGEVGNVDRLALRGAVGGPLGGDTLKARIAFERESREGFVKDLSFGGDTIDDMARTAGRLKLQFTPSEHLDFLLTADYQEFENDGGVLVTEGAVPAALIAAGAQPFEPFESLAHDTPNEGYEHETELYSLVANLRLPNEIRLKSVTSLGSHVYDQGRIDRDMTTLPMTNLEDFYFNYETFTQEFQLNGQWGKLTWVGGLFYLNEEQHMIIDVSLGSAASPIPVNVRYDQRAEWDSYAAYLSGSYAVTDRVSVTGGLRYTQDDLSGSKWNRTQVLLGGAWAGAPYMEDVESGWDDVSPRIGLEYRASDDVFLYGTVAKGFKSGGYDLATTSVVPPFDPEYVWSYEVGAKTETLDRRLRTNLTLFYYDYKDLQVRSLIPSTVGVIYRVTNAGSATLKGAELEVAGKPVDALTLGANVTWLDGTYDELIGPNLAGQPTDMAGNRLIWTPEWAFNVFGSYDMRVGDRGVLKFRVNYAWRDQMYQDPLNDALRSYDSRSNWDAAIGFEPDDGRWSINVYGRNLTDEVWFSSKSAISYGPARTDPNAFWGYISPDRRQYGVVVGFHF
ncbi:MAG: TonB-dependent receptor [Gammaproteobacteria bacterium]|nr:MAG: TonB-dependent receptor [Gammaproteobacteria bacterium]